MPPSLPPTGADEPNAIQFWHAPTSRDMSAAEQSREAGTGWQDLFGPVKRGRGISATACAVLLQAHHVHLPRHIPPVDIHPWYLLLLCMYI